MRKILLLLPVQFLMLISNSQAPPSWTSADMFLAIKKLNVLSSILYIAAHPDDENTRLISYLSKDRLYRTGYLALTRGDGGQNLIGDEQGIELGLIRTQELLAARRIDGGEQFFTRAFDFGYSKTPDETFTKWDREKILSDVVWVIRKFQPDVLITRFPTTGEGGHGHHTVSAILANEAFNAAADPKRFPEQLKFVQPWQAKRILWNSFPRDTSDKRLDNFKFDVGGYNPLLGKSYGEISALSRSQHKSQGFGNAATRGEALEYFKLTNGSPLNNDLMDGIDISWERVKGGDAIRKMVDDLAAGFDFLHPDKSVKGLVGLYQALKAMPESYWRNKKLAETQQLIEQCSGLFIDATTTDQFAVQTDSMRVIFAINNRLGVNASLKEVSVESFDTSMNQALSRNRNLIFSKTLFVSPSKPLTQPYWLAKKMEEGMFTIDDQQKIGQADVDPAFVTGITINIEGLDFYFPKTIKYKFTDPVRGELYYPVTVIPATELTVSSDLLVHKIGTSDKAIQTIQVKANKDVKNVSIYIGDKKSPEIDKLSLYKGEQREMELLQQADSASNGGSKLSEMDYHYQPVGEIAQSVRKIKYDHIPAITYFKSAVSKTLAVDLKIYGKKIGYIVGAGDKVPEALEMMGFDVNLLNQRELSKNDISKFDAIVVGVRAYNTNDWMNANYDKLMKYVNDGGNLIVQYNTSNNIGNQRAKIGPYPFEVSRNRVADETTNVTILKPDHPVFNFPNKITQEDFKGWVQDRSINDAAKWDRNFETVISMHDAGEDPDEGSLIIGKYGKGIFVYAGLALWRQLPAGVPGAYRLMANIIALNRKKAF